MGFLDFDPAKEMPKPPPRELLPTAKNKKKPKRAKTSATLGDMMKGNIKDGNTLGDVQEEEEPNSSGRNTPEMYRTSNRSDKSHSLSSKSSRLPDTPAIIVKSEDEKSDGSQTMQQKKEGSSDDGKSHNFNDSESKSRIDEDGYN